MTRTLVNITVIKYKSTDQTADGHFSISPSLVTVLLCRHRDTYGSVQNSACEGGKYKLTGLCGPVCVLPQTPNAFSAGTKMPELVPIQLGNLSALDRAL